MEEKVFNDKTYRLVTLRNRSKWIAKDGSAINPKRINQVATIHYNKDGYPCYGGGIPVHLYVAHGWVDGYFDGAEVNHKDFNLNNFDANNLEWVTHSENVEYTLKNHYDVVCKSKQGENNGRAIFSKTQVLKIRELHNQGYNTMDIIKIFYPNMTYNERKKVWGRFDYVIKKKSWKNI